MTQHELVAIGGPLDGTVHGVPDGFGRMTFPDPGDIDRTMRVEDVATRSEDGVIRTCAYYRERLVGGSRVRHVLRHEDLTVEGMIDLLVEAYSRSSNPQ